MQNLEEKPAPKVSIVIPVYNREKYLGMTIQSVLAQSYTDFELIIVDNNSTDGSLEIAQIAAQNDSRVRVLTEDTQGAAYALKKGFEAARGEYIGQVDSDDILEARAIELTTAALDEDKSCGMVYTNYVDISKDGHILRVGKRCLIPYSKESILIDFMTFHFRLIRQSVYQRSGGFDLRFTGIEDYELCLRLSEITQITKVETVLYQYRIHSEAIQTQLADLDRIALCKQAMEEALQRRNMDKTHKIEVSYNPKFFLREIRPLESFQSKG